MMNKQVLTITARFTLDDDPAEFLAYVTEVAHTLGGTITSHRTSEVSGKRALTLSGYHQGGRVPYGFAVADGGKHGALVWADDECSETLAWILKARKQGGTLRAIADQLNEQDVPAPAGGPWSHGIVRRVVAQARNLAHLVPMDHIL